MLHLEIFRCAEWKIMNLFIDMTFVAYDGMDAYSMKLKYSKFII